MSAPFSLRQVLALAQDRREMASISKAWQHNGGRLGPLGLPVTGIQPKGSGFEQFFQGGDISFLSDVLTVNQRYATTIRFKGLHCFGDQSGPGADEPYVVIGVYPPAKRELATTTQIPPSGSFSDVSAGSQRVEVQDVWTFRPPEDVVVYCVLMEHDSGNEEEVRAAIKRALDEGVDAVEAAAGVNVPDDWVNILTLTLADVITEAFGLGDDVVGTFPLSFSFAQLQQLAHNPKPLQHYGGIDFNYETDLLASSGASYKCYFEVFTEIIDRQLAPGP
ncbi:LGFP repeat-containing protein [Actinomadura scrupuli]